jgi:CRP-like cAMP-binding protein
MPNLFLVSLPQPDRERLEPYLQPVVLAPKMYIHSTGQPIEYCYFPARGAAVSNVVSLSDGSEVEAGMIGREGLVGLSALLAADRPAPMASMVQLPGGAVRVQASVLRREMLRSPDVLDRVLRFSLGLAIQAAQTAACNARHSLPQRLARWLLMVHDRAEGRTIPVTHEIISMMLGVRRPGVSIAARSLRDNGAISYTRGGIAIVDRARLAELSCECYALVRDRRRRLDWLGSCLES